MWYATMLSGSSLKFKIYLAIVLFSFVFTRTIFVNLGCGKIWRSPNFWVVSVRGGTGFRSYNAVRRNQVWSHQSFSASQFCWSVHHYQRLCESKRNVIRVVSWWCSPKQQCFTLPPSGQVQIQQWIVCNDFATHNTKPIFVTFDLYHSNLPHGIKNERCVKPDLSKWCADKGESVPTQFFQFHDSHHTRVLSPLFHTDTQSRPEAKTISNIGIVSFSSPFPRSAPETIIFIFQLLTITGTVTPISRSLRHEIYTPQTHWPPPPFLSHPPHYSYAFGLMTSSIFRIIFTTCVASSNCCFLPISVSKTFCFLISFVPTSLQSIPK